MAALFDHVTKLNLEGIPLLHKLYNIIIYSQFSRYLLGNLRQSTIQKLASPRDALRSRLAGQTVWISNLYTIFTDWRPEQGPHLAIGRSTIDAWFFDHLSDKRKLKALQAANFALICQGFYPRTSEEKYLVLLKYLGWLWIWDDEIDDGLLTHNRKETINNLEQSKHYVNLWLGPDPIPSSPGDASPNMSSFYPICADFRRNLSSASLERVRKEVINYMDEAAREQQLRESATIPSIETYWQNRHISAAARINIAQMEYAYDLNLPNWIYEHEAMKAIWDQTSALIWIVNDMISLQKEAATGQIDSLVPLIMYHNHLDIQAATDQATAYVRAGYDAFCAAEQRLPLPTGDEKVDGQVRELVRGCKEMVMGNLYWSYNTERYCQRSQIKEGNRILLQL